MAKSGNYEVDDEGNIVEAERPTAKEPDPVPVRRAMRVYGFAQLVSFTILLVMAAVMADIRALLLLFAAAYLVVAIVLHRIYRRALLRSYRGRRGAERDSTDGA